MIKDQARTIAEAFVVAKSPITTIEAASLSDLDLAQFVLALAGRAVVPAGEGKRIERAKQRRRTLH